MSSNESKGYPLVSVVIPTYNRKEKLIRLINSIFNSDYPKERLEIIVVDDESTDGTYEEVKKNFPEIKIVRNDKKKFLAGSRNVGIKNSNGKYIFLIDDDNIVDKSCIFQLVKILEIYPKIGVIAPVMYYYKQPNRIWCAGVRRNMITSLTKKIGAEKIVNIPFKDLIESVDILNAFMIRREVIDIVGPFNEKDFPIHYDEADYGEKVRRAGYKIIFNPKAKVWHDIPLPEEEKDKARLFHCHNEYRAYYCGRNRIIFHKKYSKLWQFFFFIFIFNWLFALYYLRVILFGSKKPLRERLKIAMSYLNGIWSGLKWKKSC
jgi:hypothetical protein